jgi:hypothetical protein
VCVRVCVRVNDRHRSLWTEIQKGCGRPNYDVLSVPYDTSALRSETKWKQGELATGSTLLCAARDRKGRERERMGCNGRCLYRTCAALNASEVHSSIWSQWTRCKVQDSGLVTVSDVKCAASKGRPHSVNRSTSNSCVLAFHRAWNSVHCHSVNGHKETADGRGSSATVCINWRT